MALHEQTQEWKELEGKLNIEPLTFPEQGIDRYEAAKGYKQTLEQEIGLKEEALKQLTKENKQLSVPNDDTIEQFKQIYRESDIKQSEIELNARAKEISENNMRSKNIRQVLDGKKFIMIRIPLKRLRAMLAI